MLFVSTRQHMYPFLLVLIALEVAILPAESATGASSNLALLVRSAGWVLLVAVASRYLVFRRIYLNREVLATTCVFGFAFILSNLSNQDLARAFSALLMANLFGALIVSTAVSRSNSFRLILIAALDALIWIWTSVVILQLVVFFATGEIVNFHRLLVPYSEQRTELIEEGLVRLGGVHIEPGTHANWMFGVILLRSALIGRLFDRLAVFGLFSIPATLSFWGMVATSCALLSYAILAAGRGRFRDVIIFLFVIAALVLLFRQSELSPLLDYMYSRITLEDNSSQDKVLAWTAFWDSAGNYLVLGLPYNFDFCKACWSSQDAGVLINMVTKVGFVPTFLVFGLFFRRQYEAFGLAGVAFAFPLLLSKLYYWDHLLWLLLLVLPSPVAPPETTTTKLPWRFARSFRH